jgi:hypothetical protein
MPKAITFERDYAGTINRAPHVRADLAKIAAECPAADDLILLASELATNAILQPPVSIRACHVEVSEIHGTSRDGTSRP